MKNWIKKIFGFGLASFLSDFGHEMTVSLIPVLVAQFVGAAQAPFFLGIISSISDAFASFLRIFAGYVSDIVARKKPLIMVGYCLSAVFSALVGFSRSVWELLAYRMLSFTGSGLREPPRDALIATVIEPKNYGRAFGLKSAMDTLGSLVGPLVAFSLVGLLSNHELFALSFVPGFLAVFAILFFTSEAPRTVTTSNKIPALWDNLARLPRPFVVLLAILFIFDLSVFNKLLLLARLQEMLPGDPTTVVQLVVLLYAIFNLARACSEFIIGLISDYINRILLLAFLGCGMLAGVAFLLITPHASFIYCSLICTMAGISTAARTTLKEACAADMLPADIRGLGYGILQASEGFAALISSALIGFLWTCYSPLIGFSYVIVLSLMAMVLLLCFIFCLYRRQGDLSSRRLRSNNYEV